MKDRTAVLALALALVLAGCAGPFGPTSGTGTSSAAPQADTPSRTVNGSPSATSEGFSSATPTPTRTAATDATATTTPDHGVVVQSGSLPVDEDVVFERVTSIAGRDVDPPRVTVRAIDAGSELETTPLHRMLGISDLQFPENRSAGFTYYSGGVVLDPGEDVPDVERALAHEFVHVVQFQSGMVRHPRTLDDAATTDVRMTWQTVVEGGAVYVTDAYVKRHMPAASAQSAEIARLYEDPPTPESRLTLAWYHFGYRYVDARVDEPAELGAAYDPFPNTTEQVLHEESPTAEPPSELSATVETDDRWQAQPRADRKGELFVRVLLRTELDRDRAVNAASGWGNDRWWLLQEDGGTADGLVWVLRWDSPDDADEFERAARTYVDRRRANGSGSFRVERLTEDAVGVYVGKDAFVENVTATTDGGEITVSVGEPEED